MPTPTVNSSVERFFQHHLETVAARLEHYTDEALKRQRLAWRESLHRQALLDEKDVEDFSNER